MKLIERGVTSYKKKEKSRREQPREERREKKMTMNVVTRSDRKIKSLIMMTVSS